MDTLVLDRRFWPVGRVSWTRALTLLWLGKVEVIEEYDDWTVRSITFEMKVPSVIRFVRSVFGGGRRAVRFSRENVYARDKGRCQYCRSKVARNLATFDHVVPRARGGRTGWENIVIACLSCNQKKGGRTPTQAHMRLYTVPVRPKSLPGTVRFTITYDPAMPLSWRGWLRDFTYWNGELESDSDKSEDDDGS